MRSTEYARSFMSSRVTFCILNDPYTGRLLMELWECGHITCTTEKPMDRCDEQVFGTPDCITINCDLVWISALVDDCSWQNHRLWT